MRPKFMRPLVVGLALSSASAFTAAPARADAPPSVDWTRQFGTADDETATAITLDPFGNALVAGYTSGAFGGPNAGVTDAFVTRYNPAGAFQWAAQVGSADSEQVTGVATDSAGNAFITGFTNGAVGGSNAGATDTFVTKFDAAGVFQWSVQFGTGGLDQSNGIAVDASGNILITGFTTGSFGGPSAGGQDAYVTKLNSAGAVQWTTQIGTDALDQARAITVDAAGNAYITGVTGGSLAAPSAGGFDAFLAKLDADGVLQWSAQLGTDASDNAAAIALDSAGNVLIGGSTSGSLGGPSAGSGDAFLATYTTAGSFQWAAQLGTSGAEGTAGIVTDSLGNAYITTGTTGSLGGPNAGGVDTVLAKFDPAGLLAWATQLGSAGGDGPRAIAINTSGNLFIAGTTNDAFAGPYLGGLDGFVLKFTPIPTPAALPVGLAFAALGLTLRRSRFLHAFTAPAPGPDAPTETL